MPFVCVKCAGKHPTHDCKKSINEEPKCANCSGAHTASYRGCSEFEAALFHYNKIAQLSPPTKAQAYIRSDPELDVKDTQEGASSTTCTPSDVNRMSIKKLSDNMKTLKSNLLEIKNSISAQQCHEQKFLKILPVNFSLKSPLMLLCFDSILSPLHIIINRGILILEATWKDGQTNSGHY